jgi:hypothetical protein
MKARGRHVILTQLLAALPTLAVPVLCAADLVGRMTLAEKLSQMERGLFPQEYRHRWGW